MTDPARIIDPRGMNGTDGEVGAEIVNAAAITTTITDTGIGTGVVLEMDIEIEDAGTPGLGQGREADKGKDKIEIERSPGIVEREAIHLDGFAVTTTLIGPRMATDEVENSLTISDNISMAKGGYVLFLGVFQGKLEELDTQ